MSLHDLTGGYVLGALSEAERREFEAHLATCAACAREVEALREVSTALAYAAPQKDLPAGLRERVLQAAVAQSASPDARMIALASDRASIRAPEAPVTRTPGRMLPSWLAVAASIAAVAWDSTR